MKYTHTLLLSGLLFCGCSRPTSDLIKPGKDLAWSDGADTHVMHISRRDGLSIQGIRVVDKDSYGNVTTITADTGRLYTNWVAIASYGVEHTNAVMVVLQDAQIQDAKTNQTVKQYSFVWHQ
jgi:hypothetical protein